MTFFFVDRQTGVADNYTCECPFFFAGYNCEIPKDFCTIENVQCMHGTCELTYEGVVSPDFDVHLIKLRVENIVNLSIYLSIPTYQLRKEIEAPLYVI